MSDEKNYAWDYRYNKPLSREQFGEIARSNRVEVEKRYREDEQKIAREVGEIVRIRDKRTGQLISEHIE